MSVTSKLIKILEGEIGYRESGNNHQKYSPAVPGLEWSQNQPWCATFNAWAYLKAGLRPNVDFPVTASCAAGVSWYKKKGRWSGTPKVGSQVFYGPGGGTHVEIVVAVSSSSITTIGGNTSGSLGGRYYNGDGVYKKVVRRSDSRIYGYGHPYGLDAAVGKEADDMPNIYVSLGNRDWYCTLNKGQTKYLHFDHEYSDKSQQHGDGKAYPTVLMTPAIYTASTSLTIRNLPEGESFWVRYCEVQKQADGSFKLTETGPTRTIRGYKNGEEFYDVLNENGVIKKGARMRIQVGGCTTNGVYIRPTSFKLHGWKN